MRITISARSMLLMEIAKFDCSRDVGRDYEHSSDECSALDMCAFKKVLITHCALLCLVTLMSDGKPCVHNLRQLEAI